MLLSLLPLALLSLAAPPAVPVANAEAVAPKPELGPQDVVRSVLDALRHNDEPSKDAGIATTFRFASSENRKATGPLEHFTQIVKQPAYRPFFGHKSAEVGPLRLVGDQALQRVKLVGADGKTAEYDFILSKDPKTHCWMTDGVLLTPPPVSPPPRRDVV